MRKNKLFVILLVSLVVLTFMMGCSGETAAVAKAAEPTEVKSIATVTHENGDTFSISEDTVGFEEVFSFYSSAEDMYYTYLRDRTTDAMYVWRTSGRFSNPGGFSYWTSGFTAMLDPVTGGSLTYDNWLKYLEEKNMGIATSTEKNESSEANDKVCGICGAKVHSTYCGQCGVLYEDEPGYTVCSGCGAECDTPFCGACGTRVTPEG